MEYIAIFVSFVFVVLEAVLRICTLALRMPPALFICQQQQLTYQTQLHS